MKTTLIILLTFLALNTYAQDGFLGEFYKFPTIKDSICKVQIDSVYKITPLIKTNFDGTYTKINGTDTMIIENNIILISNTYYPNLNHQIYAEASSYDNRLDNAKTTTTTYRFSTFENDSLNVFSKESSFSLSYPNIYGNKPKWDNYPNLIATYYKDFQKMKLERITDKIILFNTIYYIKL